MSLLGDIEKNYQITEESLKELGFEKVYEGGDISGYWSYIYKLRYDTSIEYWDKDYNGPAHAGGIRLNGKVFVCGTMYDSSASSARKMQYTSYIMNVENMMDMMSIIDNTKQGKVPSYVKPYNIYH